jgi:hypothetical protein
MAAALAAFVTGNRMQLTAPAAAAAGCRVTGTGLPWQANGQAGPRSRRCQTGKLSGDGDYANCSVHP